MASALQKQLAAIAASSTHQLDLKAQKSAHGKSLLFEPKVAASQSFENLYLLCYEGYRDLCALDSRFLQFSKSLFSEQSKVEDRTQMNKEENKKLDAVLEAFITLVGSKLLLKPAQKALEWLVRRFRIHEYNTECLALTYLSYHATPQFQSLLSILPSQPPPSLRFLHPYIQSPTNPPRRTLVYTAVNTPAFFNAFQAHAVRVVQAGHQSSHMLSFWSSISVEAIYGILENTSSGRRDIQAQKTEELVLRVLPALNSCMRAKYGPETVTSCYAIATVLAGRGDLGDKMLDGLMEAVLLAQDSETLTECLQCLAVQAEQRSEARIPRRVYKRLLAIPQISQQLLSISQQCHVERLVLGCALGALSGVRHSAEYSQLIIELIASRLLTESQTRMTLTALVTSVRDSVAGSEEHGQLIELAAKLADMTYFLDALRAAAKLNSMDLESMGITNARNAEDTPPGNFESDDEEMLDVDDNSNDPSEVPVVQLPQISVKSFLDPEASTNFKEVADAFEQYVSRKREKGFLPSEKPQQHSLNLNFLARFWCSPRPISARRAALREAITSIKHTGTAHELQNLVPYFICALADRSGIIRRSAARGIAALSEKISAEPSAIVWGSSDMYGKAFKRFPELSFEDVSKLFSSLLIPILEESVMDASFAISAIRDALEASHKSKTSVAHGLKAQTRSTILSFLASHTSSTPLLRVRTTLLPIFNFLGKISDPVRSTQIFPLLRYWCSIPESHVAAICEQENLSLDDVERRYLGTLKPKEASSAQLLIDIVSGKLSKERFDLLDAAFDCISIFWPDLKAEAKQSLAQSLLDLSFSDSGEVHDMRRRERALEILQSVKHDSATLVMFLEDVPSTVHMPDGPPAKKRRRTSRNEVARAELSSPADVQRLLRKLTTILELVEASSPGQHPALFRPLFNVFGELQPLKQQSDNELVYHQSMILGALSPIVDTLKKQKDTAEHQSAVRADLLIDCIRHSTSPQVQNSALLLIANLASWVPDLILHNLMPIFTFIGSNLLRQKDDYSAQVVDKTISRVVPQLAASLRSKHRNFLAGVSDLLLSFTAAFEHIPLHRRQKLFSELARTLGPGDSLSAVIALLAERYHNNKSQRRFSADLLLVFAPIHTLDAFKGYLELAIDAVGPRHKVADTLFGLKDKNAAQTEVVIKDLLASLAELATDERVRAHVTRAFRQKEESHKPRALFANIVEAIVQLSKKVASSPKLYEGCSRVLARCLDLLPTADLIQSAELLISNADVQVQVAGIKSVELRAGSALQNDRKSVVALLSFLPSIDNVLQHSEVLDVKIISVSCIDRIIERFGKKDSSAVASVAQTIASVLSSKKSDNRLRVLSLLCLTSVVDVLEDEAIALLPTVVSAANGYLLYAIDHNEPGLHNAVYTLLTNIVERLGYLFLRDDFLKAPISLSHRSAGAALDDNCDESRATFYKSLSSHITAQELFAATEFLWPDAISFGFDAALEDIELLHSTINAQTKTKLRQASPSLNTLLLKLFKLRDTIASQSEQEFDDDEILQLDNALVEATLAMVYKLNDVTLRPFFAQLAEQEGPMHSTPSHAITFYRFLGAFFEKLGPLVTTYASYILDHAAKMLEYLGTPNSAEDEDSDAEEKEELMGTVLTALKNSFDHDETSHWSSPSHYGAILTPLVALLTLPPSPTLHTHIIPTITSLAAATSSPDAHKELNNILLRYMRSDAAATRLATVKCEQALTEKLGEDWLGLLPEMLPFIDELREDDDEMVERETQRWITGMESVLGEGVVGDMLQ